MDPVDPRGTREAAQRADLGTPDQVEERLSGLRAELGLDGILAEMNCGGQIGRERMMTSLQLLCEDVIPRFKDAPAAH